MKRVSSFWKLVFFFLCIMLIGFFIGYDYSVVTSRRPEVTSQSQAHNYETGEMRYITGDGQ